MQQNDAENNSERGSSRNVLIGVLAVLLALFGYLYFFTGVIKQRGEAPQPIPAPQQLVKQPIPPRPESLPPAKVAEAPATTANAPAPQTKQPVPAPAKPAPVANPAASQPKPQASAPKPAPQPQKPVAAPAKPPMVAQKQAIATPKVAAVKPEAAKTPAKEPLHKDISKQPAAPYRIATAEIVSLQKADRIAEQLKKSGLGSVRRETVLAARPMNRLFVTEFSDRTAAGVELANLRKSSPGAFILPSGGKYELYAGSYDKEKGAESEKKRLESQGVKLTLQKANVKVPTYRVTAQAKSKEKADESLRIIRKLGSDATATLKGK